MPEAQFYGETFYLTSEPNEFALMEFAAAAEEVEVDSMAARAALLRLLHESVVADPFDDESTVESEWLRFSRVGRKNKADSETLMPVVIAMFSGATERPTVQPSDSSDGPAPTPLRSVSPPADPAMERLSGRPDLQSAVLDARKAARSA